jgi:hypothetical protein
MKLMCRRFGNTLSVPYSKVVYGATVTYKDGTDRVSRNVGTHNSDARESPKSKNTTFITRRKSRIKNKTCIFEFLYNSSLQHFSFCEELSEILLKMYTGVQVKWPLSFSDLNETWIFSTDFRKMPKCRIYLQKFIEFELFKSDRQALRNQ